MLNAQIDDTTVLDAVVVGAGLGGIYQLYRLAQSGKRVRSFEAGAGLGGVWYWNRYPGARVDSHFPFYQYWFSKELWDEGNWTERFPGQPEIERYLNHVCDKYDLRRHITFNARVTSAHFDEDRGLWTVTTDQGESVQAQFVIFNTGGLSEPKLPNFPGIESFKGAAYHTSRWPRTAVDFSGKRVGVIGTAATGIQVIQTIAPIVSQLVVFQRTPNYAVPMRNPKITEEDLATMRSSYHALREQAHKSRGGFVYGDEPPRFDDVPEDQLEAYVEAIWADGSLKIWGTAFADAFANPRAMDYLSDFVRKRIRARIKDPLLADKLTAMDYPFGTRRVPLENGYFDAFNHEHVKLVDLRETPIVRIDDTGIWAGGQHHELDAIVFATGFDAGVGAINRIDVRGRQGLSLRTEWDKRLRTTVGMQVHGFPNLFMTMAPFAPASAICNVPICVDQQVDWICDAMDFVRDHGHQSLEPSAAVENGWMSHHEAVSEPTLLGQNKNSWYRREGPDGSKRELLAYMGGLVQYRDACEAMRKSGFAGFDIR